jgi:hypothetical protein
MKELTVLKIKPPARGNEKLGQVLTESRETGPTCPITCPLYQNETCYSKKLGAFRVKIMEGMRDREAAHKANRAGWIASRVKAWTKETAAGRPVRFLVHGDLMEHGGAGLDWNWIQDVVEAAGAVPGFRGWIYTHCWRVSEASTAREALRQAGITCWASCHSPSEASSARSAGWNVALISEERKAGYSGKAHRTAQEMGTDRPAIVCVEQLGKSPSCERCGFCFQRSPKVDLVLLKH